MRGCAEPCRCRGTEVSRCRGLEPPRCRCAEAPRSRDVQKPAGIGVQNPTDVGVQNPPGVGMQNPVGVGVQNPPGVGVQSLQRIRCTLSEGTFSQTSQGWKLKWTNAPEEMRMCVLGQEEAQGLWGMEGSPHSAWGGFSKKAVLRCNVKPDREEGIDILGRMNNVYQDPEAQRKI